MKYFFQQVVRQNRKFTARLKGGSEGDGIQKRQTQQREYRRYVVAAGHTRSHLAKMTDVFICVGLCSTQRGE